MVSQERVRLRGEYVSVFAFVLIREFEPGSPTHLTTSSGSSRVFNHFVGIFRNLSCETQHMFPSMVTDRFSFTPVLLPSLKSEADPWHGLSGEKHMPGAAFL